MNKRIIILGAGESGTGAALLAKAKGYDVFVSDFGTISDSFKEKLYNAHIQFEEGKHTEEKILNADTIIKSPGINPEVEIIKKAVAKNIKVIDELEFAYQFTKGKIIAITGTNGKSTTTMMTYHLLKEAALSVGLGGNIGKSMAAQLVDQDYDWWVLECSSFQIDGFVDFKPHIAVLLNITPDHLDRYHYKVENYVNAKFSLFKNQSEEDFAILVEGNQLINEALPKYNIEAEILNVGFTNQSLNAFADSSEIVINIEDKKHHFSQSLLPIKGRHNQINAMASILTAKLTKIKDDQIKESLPKFKSIQHRLESVGNIHGVEFINDSKATNVDAVYYALEAFSRPIIWIVGGVDKGNDYSQLDAVSGNVKAIICLGKDNDKIKKHFKDRCPIIEETQSMQEAVKIGYHLSKDREVVLLSPACASFDLFKNYEDRGNQFRLAFQLLEREIELKKISQ
ncbi:UDP-N-acetylmuramoyl-L-alanine--D-glutamate ligase [Marivirga arenosa]|uniref:UDP-N-acetylmuramoylalanine--D-glutamate ligase n=1 Tax=Marivirga arenosa TaxID=3059076 RepID=A0AA52EVI3_9BACT|nr:UDP-N-acetylmuramoyl-L-alanine--D-glutamate ligase [Marivirga sp. BKB1-2]WNB17420.1 UDP-N-acetylmuramoyl-L-alanine--D-glutamate ligase [Marivirga sp. BKB1-2]